MARPKNPELPAEVGKRHPIPGVAAADAAALRKLADKVSTLAGADEDTSFIGGVAQTLRWLADGTTASEALSVVVTATEPDA